VSVGGGGGGGGGGEGVVDRGEQECHTNNTTKLEFEGQWWHEGGEVGGTKKNSITAPRLFQTVALMRVSVELEF